jgi:hypothetical protein
MSGWLDHREWIYKIVGRLALLKFDYAKFR